MNFNSIYYSPRSYNPDFKTGAKFLIKNCPKCIEKTTVLLKDLTFIGTVAVAGLSLPKVIKPQYQEPYSTPLVKFMGDIRKNNRFSGKEIINLEYLHRTNPEMLERLVLEERMSFSEGKPVKRFSYNEIVDLGSQFSNVNIIFELLDAKKFNKEKNIVEPKFSGEQIAILSYCSDTLPKNIFEKLVYETNLDSDLIVNLASSCLNNPNRIKRIKKSGMFELIKNGTVETTILDNLSRNIFLSKKIINDMEKAKKGETSVLKLPPDTKLNKIIQLVEPGEVCDVDGILYINNSKQPVRLNLSKEKFEELFPVIKRIGFYQNSFNDCWIVSVLDRFMDIPKGRTAIYKLFEQDGDDILIQFPNSSKKIRFKNGEIINFEGKQLQGAKGLKMLEQAYMVHSSNSYNVGSITDIFEIENFNKIYKSVDKGGTPDYFAADILGYGEGIWNIIKSLFISKTFQKENALKRLSNDENYVTFLTFDSSNADVNGVIDENYDLYSDHAYALKGYDPQSNVVYVTNPHNCASIIEIPYKKAYNLIKSIDSVQLK